MLEIWGLQKSSPAKDRHQGFQDALDDRFLVKDLFGKWSEMVVKNEIAAMDSLEELDVVFAHNDAMAMAAREAIELKFPGLTTGFVL